MEHMYKVYIKKQLYYNIKNQDALHKSSLYKQIQILLFCSGLTLFWSLLFLADGLCLLW